MTITPSEAIKLNVERDRVELGKLEKQIDMELKEEYTGEPVYIEIECIRPKVLDELKRRYNSAGWTVKYESDQRDGEYLIFTEVRR